MSSNKISVIITAHDRKKYILDALNSVINNAIPSDKLEIVIVKNYKDDYIDYEIEKLSKRYNIVSLIENNFKLGAKISAGIKNSQGEIVTFLEDDDLYLPYRLINILKIFNDTSIIFYHNMFEILGNKRIDEIVSNYKHNIILSCDDSKQSEYKYLASTEAKFNLSSIAVRKNILDSWTDVILKVNFAVDNLLFYISLSEKGCLMIDPKIFTKFRVSDKKDYYVKNPNGLYTFKQFISEKYYEDFILMNTIFKNSYFKDLIREGLLFWYLESKILSEDNNKQFNLNLLEYLDIFIRNKFFIALYLVSLFPSKLRKYFIRRYLLYK
ncbi:glycosyl transferase family 2 [Sulfolobus islandicus M.14.25]|uniref:Glycosyl transferase family 2 n=1 Tax=Saccharolobus islandicus (strain M.14.25 / Kamchatka \|nr:glycosyltransferase family 2 protein [Sulfolobus islandicus]ACP37766.1 glycosyl transferase family 2 [Sulfolobus islandicus M.14.25]